MGRSVLLSSLAPVLPDRRSPRPPISPSPFQPAVPVLRAPIIGRRSQWRGLDQAPVLGRGSAFCFSMGDAESFSRQPRYVLDFFDGHFEFLAIRVIDRDVRNGDMTWWRRAGRGLWILSLGAASLMLGLSQAEAAYRLTFQNGTSVEVQSYEDLGDTIRYQRYGGTVVVPKANVSAIEEAVHLPPPTPLAPAPRAPAAAPPNVTQGIQETSRPPVNSPALSPPVVARPAPARSTPVSPIGPFTMISGALKILGGFIIFMLAVAGVLFWFRFSGKIAEKADSLPYEKKPSFLSAAERSFYGVLCQAVDEKYSIFAKVRLADLLEVSWGTSRPTGHWNRIKPRHVDFVLCSASNFTPLLVIELDDSSHEREDRQERDAFVDAALDAAGLLILHVSVQHAYAPAEIRALINDHLNSGPGHHEGRLEDGASRVSGWYNG